MSEVLLLLDTVAELHIMIEGGIFCGPHREKRLAAK